MDLEEIKSYFEKNPPPDNLQWKPWARMSDSRKFLDSHYKEIANFKGNIENCPAYWRLKEFYTDMIVR